MTDQHPILIKRGKGRRATLETVYIPSNSLLAAAAMEMRRESGGKTEIKRKCGTDCVGWYIPAKGVKWISTPVDPFTGETGPSTETEHQRSEYCCFYHYDGRATRVATAEFDSDPPTIKVLHKTNLTVQMDLYGSPHTIARNEGAMLQTHLTKYERDPLLRIACLAVHGCKCAACGIDFAETYGPIADGFIHVHHLEPLAVVGKEHDVNPITDLVPLCPNCHAVAHMQDPPLTPEEIRNLLSDALA